MRDITSLCGTISCVEIEDESHRVSLDVFSNFKYSHYRNNRKLNLSYNFDFLFAYGANMTVEDTRTIPCMVYDPTVNVSLHQLSGVRFKLKCFAWEFLAIEYGAK
jgi:hypothetical protein